MDPLLVNWLYGYEWISFFGGQCLFDTCVGEEDIKNGIKNFDKSTINICSKDWILFLIKSNEDFECLEIIYHSVIQLCERKTCLTCFQKSFQRSFIYFYAEFYSHVL